MDIIINTLSLTRRVANKSQGRDIMSTLAETCKKAMDEGMDRLRTPRDFKHYEVAQQYKVYDWLNDKRVDEVLRRFFATLAAKAPYIDFESEYDRDLLKEFKFEGQEARELGIAYLMNTLSVSLKTEEKWESAIIEITIEYYEKDVIKEETVEVVHASNTEHIIENKCWFIKRKKENIKNPQELWENRDELFPNLLFCSRVEDQILSIGKGNPLFNQILKKLFKFNEYFENWNTGRFEKDEIGFKITPQSKRTLDEYESEHEFKCPDGNYRIFSWHARLTPGAKRIYFLPDINLYKGIIGHIGSKLRTVSSD